MANPCRGAVRVWRGSGSETPIQLSADDFPCLLRIKGGGLDAPSLRLAGNGLEPVIPRSALRVVGAWRDAVTITQLCSAAAMVIAQKFLPQKQQSHAQIMDDDSSRSAL